MPSPIRTLDVVDSDQVFIGYDGVFTRMDLGALLLETIPNPMGEDKTGTVVRVAGFENKQYLLCYQSTYIA
jgi:hypothetical protein